MGNIFREVALKKKLGKLHSSEEWMTPRNLPKMLIGSFLSGFIGQMFGLGGGFIYGPVLLTLGVNPQVSGSTCLYMIMFSNATSLFMFFLFGRLNIPYTLFISIFTISGVITGLFVIGKVMKRYNRPSIVAFTLAVAIIISSLFAIFSSILNLITLSNNDVDLLAGDPIC